MRALARSVALAALLAAALTWAQPSRVICGPAGAGCGPATANAPTTTTTTTSTTSTTMLLVPAAGVSDANCPSAVPVMQTTGQGFQGYANLVQTCATGANAQGYNVAAISMYVGNATAGMHVKCSVYDNASPKNHVGAGCDTLDATLATNPNAYVTMATTGACHLAAATRYWIGCNADDANTWWGYNATACAACWPWYSNAYANAWPATLSGGGTYNWAPCFYLSVTPGP